MLDAYEGFLPPLQLPPDPDNDRRDFLKKAGFVGTAAAAATVDGPLLDAQALTTATEFVPPSPQAAALLPSIGQTFKLSGNAFGATLSVNLPPPLPTLNFLGSMTVKALTGGPTFVRVQTLACTLQAAHPMFGKITMTLPGIDANPASILSLGPGGLMHTMVHHFAVTFEKCGDRSGPFAFTTLSPATFRANLPNFPPPPQGTNPDGGPTGGQLYTLLAPISLGTTDPGGAQTQYAQVQGMNLNVGQILA